jgi:hypothetical protein
MYNYFAGGSNPFPSGRPALDGIITLAYPFTQFPLGPTSNGGAYSQFYGPASNYTEGSYTHTFPSTFTVDKQPAPSTLKGNYFRTAGRAKEAFAKSINATPGRSLKQFLRTWPSTVVAADDLYLDLQMQATDAGNGLHQLRCLSRPSRIGALINDHALSLLPQNPNRADLILRFLQPLDSFPQQSGPLRVISVAHDAYYAWLAYFATIE